MGVLMLDEKAYTNDVRYISKRISQKYPEFKPFFRRAARWVVYPISDRKKVKDFLNEYANKYFKFWEKLLN